MISQSPGGGCVLRGPILDGKIFYLIDLMSEHRSLTPHTSVTITGRRKTQASSTRAWMIGHRLLSIHMLSRGMCQVNRDVITLRAINATMVHCQTARKGDTRDDTQQVRYLVTRTSHTCLAGAVNQHRHGRWRQERTASDRSALTARELHRSDDDVNVDILTRILFDHGKLLTKSTLDLGMKK